MIELYVLLTLGAIGYIANAANSRKAYTSSNVSIRKSDIPSMKNVYDTNHFINSQKTTAEKAHSMYKKSLDPVRNSVINKNFAKEKQDHMDRKVKSLTGEYVHEAQFTHNNMIPYFGGRMRQNMDAGANSSLMESYTGVPTEDFKRKCEVPSMFSMTKDLGHVNGMDSKDDFYKDRITAPRVRNNELPFDQIRVGPGLGEGFTDKPSGGFQSLDMQEYAMPKCVDELRAANKPKVTFEGRMVDGQKTSVRGEMGKMEKNRVNRFYEQNEDHLFRTTGAYLKPTDIPEFNVKATHRLDTTREYMGTAVANQKARTIDASVRPTHKSQYGEYGLRNASLATTGKGESYDHGKSQILVYANERDITTTRVHQGNVTSLIKAIVAPILDILKTTKKDDFIDNPRHFGNMSIQIPEKGTIQDPNDVAKTTIKETMLHDAILGNLKGNEKLTIYDPNDVARTTIKETLIHDETGTGVITGPKQLFVYDPDEIAKTTLRETLERMDYEMNLAGGARKGKVYDPDDVARTTMKETLEDCVRDGNLDRVEGMGDYKTTDFDPRRTQKEMFSDNDYIGSATRDLGMGYETNASDVKRTQKEFLSDIEYFGQAEASTDKKQMSYDDMYNAEISVSKESVIHGREPTLSGKKVTHGGECINMGLRKNQCDNFTERSTPNRDKVHNEIPSLNDNTFTRMKKDYGQDDRMDVSLLKAFLENPYTQPLNSIA